MRIVTFILPKELLREMDRLVQKNGDGIGMYPSRSELVRASIRDYLETELDYSIYLKEGIDTTAVRIDFTPPDEVVVPYEYEDENGITRVAYKSHKILRRLE